MANLFLTGSGLPTPAIGQTTDYYRDTESNLIYYRAPTGWEAVSSLIPTPDGVGTTWYHGDGSPNSGLGVENDYYRDELDGTIYRKHAIHGWVSKGSLDFIGVYGVQWGEGIGAPPNLEPFNNLPAGSFYLDVATSNIYYKDPSLTWSLKGQLGGGSSINVVDGLTSTSATDALSAKQGKVLNDRLGTIEGNQSNYLTTSTASSTYQTQSGMSNYLTTSTASSTYQTQSGMSNYLTTSTASSTYATVANQRYTFVSDSNTTYTVPASAVTENGRTIIELSNNSLTSITVDTDTGAGKISGDSVNISITGTYAAQELFGSGVTLQGDLTFSYQHQTKTLIYKGSNIWKIVG